MTPALAQHALYGLLLLYALLLPWRMWLARDGVAGQSLLASYLLLLGIAWWALPFWPTEAWLLPVLYPYAWGGIAALLWLPFALTLSPTGLQLRPATDARLATCLAANLMSHLGLLLSACLKPGLLLDYALSPSLAICAWYAGYRSLLITTSGARQLTWSALLLPAVLTPLLLRLSSASLALVQQLAARF